MQYESTLPQKEIFEPVAHSKKIIDSAVFLVQFIQAQEVISDHLSNIALTGRIVYVRIENALQEIGRIGAHMSVPVPCIISSDRFGSGFRLRKLSPGSGDA